MIRGIRPRSNLSSSSSSSNSDNNNIRRQLEEDHQEDRACKSIRRDPTAPLEVTEVVTPALPVEVQLASSVIQEQDSEGRTIGWGMRMRVKVEDSFINQVVRLVNRLCRNNRLRKRISNNNSSKWRRMKRNMRVRKGCLMRISILHFIMPCKLDLLVQSFPYC